jgi:hypothetical protein
LQYLRREPMSTSTTPLGIARLDNLFDAKIEVARHLGDALYDKVYAGCAVSGEARQTLINEVAQLLCYLTGFEIVIHGYELPDRPFADWFTAVALPEGHSSVPKETEDLDNP